MRHFSVIPEVAAPNSDSKKAYTQLYKEKLDDGHFEAMRDLLSRFAAPRPWASLLSDVPVLPPVERVPLG